MRVLRLMVLIAAMLGGAIGLSATVNAAPLPVAGIVGDAAEAPVVQKAYWYFRRRHYRRSYYRPRYYYRRRFYRPRYYGYRRHYWRRRFFF